MPATENQLEYVRQNINDVPREEWRQLALAADVPHRSLYNFDDPAFNPHYNTVFNLCVEIKRAKKRLARRAKKCA